MMFQSACSLPSIVRTPGAIKCELFGASGRAAPFPLSLLRPPPPRGTRTLSLFNPMPVNQQISAVESFPTRRVPLVGRDGRAAHRTPQFGIATPPRQNLLSVPSSCTRSIAVIGLCGVAVLDRYPRHTALASSLCVGSVRRPL